MNGVLVDTSAYRYMIRKHPKVQENLEAADKIFLNAVIMGEVLCGFDRGGSPEKNRQVYEHFIASRDVSILSIDAETAVRYAFLFSYLQKAGTMVSPNDLWIAASAMQHGLRVVTLDQDYLKIPQILVDCFDPV